MLGFLASTVLTFGLVLGNKSHDIPHRKKASTMTVPEPRIINGTQANNAAYPWFAGGPQTGCGAALIHSDILVTAAHCQNNFPLGLTIMDEQGQEFNRNVSFDLQVRNKEYDKYSPPPLYLVLSDIMLLKLTEPIYDITPIAWNINEQIPATGDRLTVIGYGLTDFPSPPGEPSDVLLQADMVYVDSNTCRVNLEPWFEEVGYDDPALVASLAFGDEVLCTGRLETEARGCKGDSGGPLFTQDDPPLLVGLVSWSVDCGIQEEYPYEMFTRIGTFDSWIRQNICEWSEDKPDYCDDYPPDPIPDTYIYNMVLEFTYDDYPWETTFAVRENLSNGEVGNILFSGPIYVPQSKETRISEFMLPPGTFTFEVYDSFEDGLLDPAGIKLSYTLGDITTLLGTYGPEDFEFTDYLGLSFTLAEVEGGDPTSAPDDTPEPTSAPDDTPEPTSTPDDTLEPTSAPDDMPEPTSTPDGSDCSTSPGELLSLCGETGVQGYGYSVSINEDIIVIGSWGDNSEVGSVFVYERNPSTGQWEFIQRLTPSDDKAGWFGDSVAVYGTTIVVGSMLHGYDSSGAVYIFERDSDDYWYEVQIITSEHPSKEDYFGDHVAIYEKTIVVGESRGEQTKYGITGGVSNTGAAYVYGKEYTGWNLEAELWPPGDASKEDGYGLSVSIWGDIVVIGAPGDIGFESITEGYTVIFHGSVDSNGVKSWAFNTVLHPSDGYEGDRFGESVAVYQDTIVIGGLDESYVFDWYDDGWAETQKLSGGYPVAIEGDVIIAAGYLYTKDETGTWIEQVSFPIPTGASLSEGTVVLGYPDDGTTGSAAVF